MSSTPQFCTQQDVERAVGDAATLASLLDKDGDGIADPQAVQDVIDMGCNEVASYVQRLIDLASLSSPFPRVLILKVADVCAYHAYARGTLHQGIPDNIQAMYDSAIRWAQDVGEGRATLAVAPQVALNAPPAGVVDFDQ